jgi:hypothetical protein
MNKFNDWLGDRLSYWLSTMAVFYGITFLILSTLFFQKPTSMQGWLQYIISIFFQGVALPVLGYTSRKAGDVQAKMLKETHDASMQELGFIKKQQEEHMKELFDQKKIIKELHLIIKEIHKKTCL